MFRIFGCFIFRNEGNGCLTSVYLEHNGIRQFTESCIRRGNTNDTDPFVGEYNTSWLEPENRTALLTIAIDDNNNGLYNLTWTEISGSENFQYSGKGFMHEGRLSGTYWGQTELNN